MGKTLCSPYSPIFKGQAVGPTFKSQAVSLHDPWI